MELSSIAKPYVNAILSTCMVSGNTQSWLAMLEACVSVMSHELMLGMTTAPKISNQDKKATLLGLVNQVLGQKIAIEQVRLIGLLIDNQRLEVLPTIYTLFSKLSKKNDNRKTFQIKTAYSLSQEQHDLFENSLKGKDKAKVVLQASVDPSLLGGAVIQEEDKVIDNTIKAKLEKLTILLSTNK